LGTRLTGTQITGYKDADGNMVIGAPRIQGVASIEFLASNCQVQFAPGAQFQGSISFRRDNARVSIGRGSWFRGQMSLGLDCTVTFGDNIYCGRNLYVTTAEGADITLGDDLLISDNCYIRADDSHPIYDATSGHRINPSRSITVENHVWIGQEVFIMPGSHIATGSVVGARSMVTKSTPIPAHSLAVGSPAKVQRRDIHWVRKHLQNSTDIEPSIPGLFTSS
jgi:acetyltransferase-like isoleucine patch superfamily enzyme